MLLIICFFMAVALGTPVPANLQFKATRFVPSNTFSTIVPSYTPTYAPTAEKPKDVKIMFNNQDVVAAASVESRRTYNNPSEGPSLEHNHYELL
ncbi:unnamed protein product [Debaryomyces tyrocola]|nr:unnamed protein product [Debaryomyces tyrocola]